MTSEQEQELANLRREVEMLRRQNISFQRQLQHYNEWMDTVCSLPWKRLWWWLCGYRFYRLGRWYGKHRN